LRHVSSESSFRAFPFAIAGAGYPSSDVSRWCPFGNFYLAPSATVVSPLSTLITSAARRFAVQRWTSSGRSSSDAICHLAGLSTFYYWGLQFQGVQDTSLNSFSTIFSDSANMRAINR
jgi:hypothetical protein